MDDAFATVQRCVTVVLYLAAALAIGASMSALWLHRRRSDWAVERLPRLRACALAACAVALLASVCVLVLESAAMAEVPLADAGPAVKLMLLSTHYGAAWTIGAVALAIACGIGLLAPKPAAQTWAIGTLLALAVFSFSRSMVSHASGSGDLSLPVVADWIHLGLACLWLGEVVIAGLVVLRGAMPRSDDARRDRASYISSLSGWATLALAGVLATGLFGAWRQLGSIDELWNGVYGRTLLAKLAVVALAVALGGINRFLVMPGWLALETMGRAAPPLPAQRFRLVLRIEALVLLSALTLAVLLASTAPPSSAS